MDLTVLGGSAAYAGPGQACSGYLLADGRTQVLLDCGSGSLSNLLRWTKPELLAAIVISHLHTDHFADIYPLRYYLQYSAQITAPIPVYAPPAAQDFTAQLLSSRRSVVDFLNLFDFIPLDRGKTAIGSIEMHARSVEHGIPAFAFHFQGGSTLAYSGDTLEVEALVELAGGAGSLLCEATFQAPDKPMGAHLSATQAGRVAAEAGVGRLILTHIWPTYDKEISRKQAAEEFTGEIELATENKTYRL